MVAPLTIVALPFGADGVLTSLFAEISVTTSPPGDWQVERVEVDSPGLLHSSVYGSEEVLSLVSTWMIARQH